MNKEQSFLAWLGEALASMGSALAVTFTLWIRRLLSLAVDRRLLDRAILDRGLAAPPPVQPASAPTPVKPPSSQQPRWWQNQRPAPTSSSWMAPREGAGVISVESHDGQRFQVTYDAVYEDRDGNRLYDHNVELNDLHAWPCPLLKVNTACTDCQFYVSRGSYRSDPMCAAVYKLRQCPDSYADTVRSVAFALEHDGG